MKRFPLAFADGHFTKNFRLNACTEYVFSVFFARPNVHEQNSLWLAVTSELTSFLLPLIPLLFYLLGQRVR